MGLADRFAGSGGIVTGASSGIGRSIALRLAAEGAGVCLVAAPNDKRPLEELQHTIEQQGGRAVSLAADVGDPTTSERAVAQTRSAFGRIDLLASNAGIARQGDIFDTPIADLDESWHVNVRGMWLMVIAAARAMRGEPGAAIVCTASSASILPDETMTSYAVTKGGVAQLVRGMALDLAPYGIRVNGVAPGWTHTPATAALIDNPTVWAQERARIPLDRAAHADEIAAVVAFLLSREASYVHGAIVPCDGGLTAGFRSYVNRRE